MVGALGGNDLPPRESYKLSTVLLILSYKKREWLILEKKMFQLKITKSDPTLDGAQTRQLIHCRKINKEIRLTI
jgi:hypothetical protein